jgi:DNA polymerase-3 subunit epsilon
MAGFTPGTPIAPETPLAALDFVAFDTETTGCASATGRMVEIGAIRFRLDGSEQEHFTRLVNPLRPIPRSVTAIHGITDEMVRDCAPESGVLPEFLAFLGDPSRTVLMAHNARFDMAFVAAALARCGLDAPPHTVIDTVRLARQRFSGLTSYSLRSLVRYCALGDATEHRGLADSIALMGVFLRLAAKPPALKTAGDLFALASTGRMWGENSDRRRPATEAGVAPFGRRWFAGRKSFSTESSPVVSDISSSLEGCGSGCEHDVRPDETVSSRSGDEPARLAAAITMGRTISIVYDGGRTAGQRRRLTPLKIVESFEVAYLVAYCHTDRRQKQYRLDRIRELIVE